MSPPIRPDVQLPEVQLLGPVMLICADRTIVSLPRQRQKVLGLLAAVPGTPQSVNVIASQLWPGSLPSRAEHLIREHLRMLRGYLGEQALHRTDSGYLLDPDSCLVDSVVFQHYMRIAQNFLDSGRFGEATPILARALDLWRDKTAFTSIRDVFELNVRALALEEMFFQCQEFSAICALRNGQARSALPTLRELVHRYPRRESPWLLLMCAEAMAGRVREALETTFPAANHYLVKESGLDCPLLHSLQYAILHGDTSIALLPIATRSMNSSL